MWRKALKFFTLKEMNWSKPQELANQSWRCGHCGDTVSSTKGLSIGQYSDGSGKTLGGIWICSNCNGPTFFSPKHGVYPGVSFGSEVQHLPDEIADLYTQARRCTSQNCYTAAVLLCRKILMCVAVKLGYEEEEGFEGTLQFLADKNYVPPNAMPWIEHLRAQGCEADHVVVKRTVEDAKQMVVFTEMLLKLTYEFPTMAPEHGDK